MKKGKYKKLVHCVADDRLYILNLYRDGHAMNYIKSVTKLSEEDILSIVSDLDTRKRVDAIEKQSKMYDATKHHSWVDDICEDWLETRRAKRCQEYKEKA